MAETFELFNGNLHWELHRFPSAGRRKNHSATLVGGRVYFCCGYELQRSRNLNDVTFLEETTQENKKKFRMREVFLSDPLRPLARNGNTATLVEDKLFLFGGWGNNHALNDVWVFDLVLRCWSKPETRGAPHPMLNMHVSEYIDWMNCILCFGGGDGRVFENSVTCLYLLNLEWKKLTPKGTPPPPAANVRACLVGYTYYIFGGWNRIAKQNDIHLLHLPRGWGKPFWSSPEVGEKPPTRVGAGMAGFYGRVLMFGGQNGIYHKDLQFYDVKEQRWHKTKHVRFPKPAKVSRLNIEVTGSWPVGRVGHTVTTMPSGSLLVYGGSGTSSNRNIIGGFHTLSLVNQANNA